MRYFLLFIVLGIAACRQETDKERMEQYNKDLWHIEDYCQPFYNDMAAEYKYDSTLNPFLSHLDTVRCRLCDSLYSLSGMKDSLKVISDIFNCITRQFKWNNTPVMLYSDHTPYWGIKNRINDVIYVTHCLHGQAEFTGSNDNKYWEGYSKGIILDSNNNYIFLMYSKKEGNYQGYVIATFNRSGQLINDIPIVNDVGVFDGAGGNRVLCIIKDKKYFEINRLVVKLGCFREGIIEKIPIKQKHEYYAIDPKGNFVLQYADSLYIKNYPFASHIVHIRDTCARCIDTGE